MAMLLMVGTSTAAFAAQGGMPAAHGVDGKTFGGLVSDVAMADPGALADHVSGNVGGVPAAHGLSGAGFGAAVSGLAQSDPGALAGHVSGR